MRKMFTILVIALVSALFAMCSKKHSIPIESSWAIDKLFVEGNEISIPAGHNPYLAFLSDSKISGETGCNRFFGDFAVKGKSITFTNMGSTRMMCPDMAFENAWLGTIQETAAFTISGSKLTLKDKDGNIIAILSKIEPTAMEN